MVCVSVKQGYEENRLKLDLMNMNSGASWFHSDELEDMDGTGLLNYVIYIRLREFYPVMNAIGTPEFPTHTFFFLCIICSLIHMKK